MKRAARAKGGKQLELRIESLGAKGDGLAHHPESGQPIHVPLTLPEERVRARLIQEKAGGIQAEPLELLEISDQRQDAPCPHFGACGGCSLQHWRSDSYSAWKQERVLHTLQRAGFKQPNVRPLVSTQPSSRRRATLAVEINSKGQAQLGFRARASHHLVSVPDCLILRPALQRLLSPLQEFAQALFAPKTSAKFHLTETDAGVDLLIHANQDVSHRQVPLVTDFAQSADLAQISWNKELLLTRRAPRLSWADVAVAVPSGAFLQACADIQDAMTQALLSALPEKTARCADLYCGLGSFTLPLLKACDHVLAADSAKPAIDALSKAARQAGVWHKLDLRLLDLDAWPLPKAELGGLDVVVFDPPRAGAKEQVQRIAQARVPHVIAISCNPATLARDLMVLQQAGYQLDWAQGFDQFLWSAHLEIMAVLRLNS